jgi:hypothetical protein
MNAILKSLLRSTGIEVRRISKAGATQRPIASIRCFLEDIKARGFSRVELLMLEQIATCRYVKAAVGRDVSELALTVYEDLLGPTFLAEPHYEKTQIRQACDGPGCLDSFREG